MSKKELTNDELIEWCRKEAARQGQMQGDKENQTARRRKTFRYRNHMLRAVGDRFTELEAAYAHTVEDCEDLVRVLDAVKLEVKLNPSVASKELQPILEREQGGEL